MSDTEYGIVYIVAVPRFSRAAVTRFDLALSRNRALDEVLVPADAQVGEHGVDDPPFSVDQESGPPYAEAERTIHSIGPDRDFVFVRQQREGQAVLVRGSGRWLSGDCGLTPTTRRPDARICACRSRRSQASFVQPGVKSAG